MAEEGYTITRRTAEAIQKMLFEHERRVRGKTPMRRRRRSAAGKKGGAQLFRLEITGTHADSPTGDDEQYIFTGNVYGDGFAEAPTKEGVTVWVSQLADGVEDLDGFRTGLAVRRPGQTWTDKNGTDVTETIYEIDVPRLL